MEITRKILLRSEYVISRAFQPQLWKCFITSSIFSHEKIKIVLVTKLSVFSGKGINPGAEMKSYVPWTEKNCPTSLCEYI